MTLRRVWLLTEGVCYPRLNVPCLTSAMEAILKSITHLDHSLPYKHHGSRGETLK